MKNMIWNIYSKKHERWTKCNSEKIKMLAYQAFIAIFEIYIVQSQFILIEYNI